MTEFSAPSAQVKITVELEMSSFFEMFSTKKVYNFKIQLFGEDIDAGDVDADANVATESDTSEQDDDFVFEWDYNYTKTSSLSSTNTPFVIEFYSISPTGLLFLKFNKPFIEPQIRSSPRELAGLRQFEISEVLEFSVTSTTLDDEELEDLLI